MIRAVLDTNVFLRALINPHSYCGRLFDDLVDRYTLVLSPPIIREVLEVLHRPKILAKFPHLANLDMGRVIGWFEQAHVVVPGDIDPVSRDPDDDMFLACAREAGADWLVTEDKDLLVLMAYEGTRICRPAEFIALLSAFPPGLIGAVSFIRYRQQQDMMAMLGYDLSPVLVSVMFFGVALLAWLAGVWLSRLVHEPLRHAVIDALAVFAQMTAKEQQIRDRVIDADNGRRLALARYNDAVVDLVRAYEKKSAIYWVENERIRTEPSPQAIFGRAPEIQIPYGDIEGLELDVPRVKSS